MCERLSVGHPLEDDTDADRLAWAISR
jgi:hypothetical protein